MSARRSNSCTSTVVCRPLTGTSAVNDIVDGLALQEYDQLVAGALLVALLAIVTEVAFAALARASAPPGMTVSP